MINEDVKQYWPCCQSWEFTAGDRSPSGHMQLIISFKSSLLSSKLVCTLLVYEDIMGGSVESLTKVKVRNNYYSHLIHQTSHLLVEGYQVSQT